MNTKIVIGLDFGTDKCCITYQDKNGIPYVITEDGSYKISSIIGILNNGILVGNDIKKNMLYDIPIITGIKRLIGNNLNSINAKTIINYSSLSSKEDMIVINNNSFSVRELVYILMKKIKTIITTNIGENFSLVITVPANFNEGQKNILLQTCSELNIDFKRFLFEPCSAAIAYINYFKINDLKNNLSQNLLVFDFGAGTLDLSIVNVTMVDNELIANITNYVGNNNFGGIDIDIALKQLIFNKYPDLKQKETNDYSFNFFIEKIKILLSSEKKYSSIIQQYNNIKIVISYQEYYDMLNYLFKSKIINLLDKLHSTTCSLYNIKSSDINEILLIGGSCYNYWIHNLVSSYYNQTISNHEITVYDHFNKYKIDMRDIAVSLGASCIDKKITNFGNGIIITENLPLSLGINTINNIMCKMLYKGSLIPCCVKKYFTTTTDQQNKFEIELYQGECDIVTDNYFLGKFSINNIPLCKAGVPVLIISLSVSTDGLITIEGTIKGHENHKNKLIINRNSVIINNEQIDNNIYKYETDDKIFTLIMKKYYSLITMLGYLQYNLIDNISCKMDDKIIDEYIQIFWNDLILIYKLLKEIPKIAPNIQKLKEIIIYIIKKRHYNVNFDRVDCLDNSIVIEKLDNIIKIIEYKFASLISSYQIQSDVVSDNFVTVDSIPENNEDVKSYLYNYIEHIEDHITDEIIIEKIFNYIDNIIKNNITTNIEDIKNNINNIINISI